MKDKNFIITKTQIVNDTTTVFYTESSLNISGSLSIDNDDFEKAIMNGGYQGVGEYILKNLYSNIGLILDINYSESSK